MSCPLKLSLFLGFTSDCGAHLAVLKCCTQLLYVLTVSFPRKNHRTILRSVNITPIRTQYSPLGFRIPLRQSIYFDIFPDP